MDNNSTNNEQLMRYIDGEMNDAEKQDFESALRPDKDLREEAEHLSLAKSAVRSFGLKEKVGHIHQQMMDELKTEKPVRSISNVRRFVRISIAVAASVILLVAGIEGYNFYRLNPNRMFAENYTSFELSTTRDGQITETSIEGAYRTKDYNEVIRLNGSSVVSIKDIFLTGMAYMETSDIPKAISSFQVVIADVGNDKTTILKDASEYYLALAYLKNRDYDQAIELMEKIHNDPSHLYKEKFTPRYINRVKRLKWR